MVTGFSSAATVYEVWDDKPAPNRGPEKDWRTAKNWGRYPYDQDWEQHSYPMGNGYMGINLFGRTDVERIQLTEKTFYNKGMYGFGGLTSFADIFLEMDHTSPKEYRRALNLNEAITRVEYQQDGVGYTREYFVSYPDQVAVVHVTADSGKKISLTVRPEIPYLDSINPDDAKTGTVVAENDLLTLSGTVQFRHLNYEGQVKVLHQGGRLKAVNTDGRGTIRVSEADEVTILIAAGTNYQLQPDIFLHGDHDKLDAKATPHKKISAIIQAAEKKGFEALKAAHLKDYGGLFDRVSVSFCTPRTDITTQELLRQYKNGATDPYLEEMMFHYGRYLLIASSREESLPSHLQGAWSQWERTPWTGSYWHNINVQMNYWGAMSCDLPETFESYIRFFKAYLPGARNMADRYLGEHNADRQSGVGQNGWTVGTAVTPYTVSAPGGHSGPGTGGFTTKLLMEYYHFTQDTNYLREVGYPALKEMSIFYDKALKPYGDLLLVEPSASPEQRVENPETVEGKPGHVEGKGYYITVGTTFDQGFVWENHNDVLQAAAILGDTDPFIEKVKSQMNRLDPILIGDSGQIKEYREETVYSEIGDPKHRHISHLCPLYPGTLIHSGKPEWMEAASKTLDMRGYKTTGWAMAHRMNCRARLKEGDKAHRVYQAFIADKTVPNLWTLHPPFQVDGNFGVMSGVAEMLLQSHEGTIDILPALPTAWKDGEFKGLVARGNFACSAEWKNGRATQITITSRSGQECTINYPGIAKATVVDRQGKRLKVQKSGSDNIRFATEAGACYRISF